MPIEHSRHNAERGAVKSFRLRRISVFSSDVLLSTPEKQQHGDKSSTGQAVQNDFLDQKIAPNIMSLFIFRLSVIND